VVIDVFRAFTTAAVAFANGAEAIVMVDEVATALALRDQGVGRRCLGERGGIQLEGFDFGNSPDAIRRLSFAGETLIQTTSNGTRGIAAACRASAVYAASLVNAAATVQALLESGAEEITLVPAGSGQNRTDEDEVCALYLRALLRGRAPDRDTVARAIETLSPQRDGGVLSREDLAMCLEIDTIPLAIRVESRGELHYARPIRF
jgi:2-phosphosulfolactate phosphatase